MTEETGVRPAKSRVFRIFIGFHAFTAVARMPGMPSPRA